MKRSSVVDIIASWAEPEILQDVYANNTKEWADNLLDVLENEIGILPPKNPKLTMSQVYSKIDLHSWEPENET
jgi:hypothetical protein